MKKVIILLAIGVPIVIGGYFVVHRSSVSIRNALPQTISQLGNPSPSIGKVKGISTIAGIDQVSQGLQTVGRTLVNVGSMVGIQTAQNGQQLLQNMTTVPQGSPEAIDLSQAVHQLQSQAQKIPGAIAKQAQIEYCKQVLRDSGVLQK